MTNEAEPQVVDAADVEEKAPPSDAQLKGLRDHAAALWTKQREVEDLTAKLKAASEEISVLETKTIPDAMREVGMEHFSLTGGFSIALERVVAASISKAAAPAAHEWLERYGFGSIIKHDITISFGKDEDKWAKKFLADLAKRKRPLRAERKDVVHSGTLRAFVRERVDLEKAGQVPDDEMKLPRDLFGVFEFVKATLIEPKEKKPRGKKSAATEEGIEM